MELDRSKKILIAVLLSGLALRLILSPFFADYNDFAYWTGTSFDVIDGNGIYRGYDYWYPPVWGYLIAAVNPLLDLFGCTPVDTVIDSASSIGYWSGDGFITYPAAVFVIKLPLILSDIACGYLVYSITRRITSDETKSLTACALWIFCPLTVFTSAVQGQFETIEALFILLALWSYLKGSYIESGAFIAAAVLTKPFAALAVIPLAALILMKGDDWNQHLRSAGKFVLGGLVMTAFLILPQLVSGETEYLFGFLTSRSSVGYPLPSGYAMSIGDAATTQSIGDLLSPSGSNVSTLFPVSFLLSLILGAFIIGRKGASDVHAVMIVTTAVCLHLIWYSGTGYSQYYVPIIALLSICTSLDRRFVYAYAAATIFTMTTALWGFRHAYQLYLWDLVDLDTLDRIYSTMRAVLDIPDTIATNLKFLPILATAVVSILLIRRSEDEA